MLEAFRPTVGLARFLAIIAEYFESAMKPDFYAQAAQNLNSGTSLFPWHL